MCFSSHVLISHGLTTCTSQPVTLHVNLCCHTIWCGKPRMVWLPDGEKVYRYI